MQQNELLKEPLPAASTSTIALVLPNPSPSEGATHLVYTFAISGKNNGGTCHVVDSEGNATPQSDIFTGKDQVLTGNSNRKNIRIRTSRFFVGSGDRVVITNGGPNTSEMKDEKLTDSNIDGIMDMIQGDEQGNRSMSVIQVR